MKRRLKGRHRYFPGCLYCQLIFIILSLIAVAILAFSVGLENIPMDNAGTIVLFIIVFIPTLIFCYKSGEFIFDLTERTIRRRLDIKGKFEKDAHAKAEILEHIIFIGILFIAPLLFFKIVQHFNGNTDSPPPINGWDQ